MNAKWESKISSKLEWELCKFNVYGDFVNLKYEEKVCKILLGTP